MALSSCSSYHWVIADKFLLFDSFEQVEEQLTNAEKQKSEPEKGRSTFIILQQLWKFLLPVCVSSTSVNDGVIKAAEK